jgi:hypothetical protein
METTLRRVLAVLIALRGAGNILKPFGTGSGLVVLGRLHPPDTLLAPALGLYMIVYAAGLWMGRGFALAMGIVYAAFVTLNLVLFPAVEGLPERIAPWMYGVYGVVGLAISWGAVWLLVRLRRRSPVR